MKKILFAALAATTLFAACSKDNTGTTNATGENVIVVNLPANVTTRAIEAPVNDHEQATTVSNAIVFLANSGTGSIMRYEVFTDDEITAKYKRIEQVPSAVDKVIVVANTPDDEFINYNTLTTYEAVTKYAFSVAKQNAGLGGIADKTLMGEGSPNTVTPDPLAPGHDPNHNYKEVNIALDALTARFEIGAVKAGIGVEKVELIGVWINNFYRNGSKADIVFNNSDSPYWSLTPVDETSKSPSTTEFITSIGIPEYLCEKTYYNAANAQVELDALSKVYSYHVFAGATIPHVILLVKGQYKDNYYEDGKKFFFGWITFRNYFDAGSGAKVASIVPNTIYKIGVGTAGVVIDADTPITPYPEESYDLGIKCTITEWTAKTVNPSVE